MEKRAPIGAVTEVSVTAAENLASWHGEMAALHELALLQVGEAAKRFVNAARDLGTLRALIGDILTEPSTPTPLWHTQRLFERIACCRALFGAAPELFGEEAPTPTPPPEVKDENAVAMRSSPVFSAALSRFSALLPGVRPLFCQSYANICEAVAAGNAAFGILPLEDSVEGKLFRLYEQIEHFELHIACTADLPLQEDGKSVRAALLCKSKPTGIVPVGTRTLECLLYEENDCSLPDLLTVASAFGLSLRRIDSLPISYREDGFAKHLVLRAEREQVGLFAAYLSLFMPRTVITADYINMEE